MPERTGAKEIGFRCLEPGCPESVTYRRKTVLGLAGYEKEGATKVVYLTCPKGHTHRYEVMVAAGRKE